MMKHRSEGEPLESAGNDLPSEAIALFSCFHIAGG